ncbi:predicted protein [Arabidopsis lyrata subsp. lyrata]|uniref:Predicted protein n=1 Tax=Arabidopsis lyrata subsp. lyrata TaxID=81972 RepID=D7MKA1_ARALL|nr:predicted protein [Arabidopsis lyrata subsp. lyrata]
MNSSRRSSVSPSSPSTPFVVGVFGCYIRRGWVAKSARSSRDRQVRCLRRCSHRPYVYIRQQYQYQEIHGQCTKSSLSLSS